MTPNVMTSSAVHIGDEVPLVIVSSDTHIGPRMREDLRPYCPASHLDAFDEYAAQSSELRKMFRQFRDTADSPLSRNATDGHHDMHARIRDLDRDGVAAELIFHGSQNVESIPFSPPTTFEIGPSLGADFGLLGVGFGMYNQWLADVTSIEPERHVGLAQLPMWDVDLAVEELERVRRAGLRGINFPAPKPHITPYNDASWEPFWSACEDLDVVLANHGGAGSPQGFGGVGGFEIQTSELAALSKVSPMNHLIFGGVFERHPKLRLMITELPGAWWKPVVNELDSIYLMSKKTPTGTLGEHVPRLPSEYFASNVFIGASFTSRDEAFAAVRDGMERNICWGSDYPHVEGTWAGPRADDEVPMTHRALRWTFAGLEGNQIRRMVGLNAIEALGLDHVALTRVATRIGAPSVTDVSVRLDHVPEDGGLLAFRTFGPWA
jgi:predicted TIM-barrel fold metal-dependent hydrolase